MQRFALFTNVISPHQLPLAGEIAKKVGEDNFRYIYTQVRDKDHQDLAWNCEVPPWCISIDFPEANDWLENAQSLLSGIREFNLFERRAAKGLKNFYMSERWFKPPIGMWRLAHPRYFSYANHFCRLMSEGKLFCLPIGLHAAHDMARLCGLMHGDLRCIFRAPELDFEKKPGGKIWLKDVPWNTLKTQKYCLDKMWIWGYYVASSRYDTIPVPQKSETDQKVVKLLWVGRLLKWKRVDTIVRAVKEYATLKYNGTSLPNITLDIYGTGPERERLKSMAHGYEGLINFYPPVSITEVRRLMHEHDVYVLSSNGYEGWGAVVSEALEEGMKVIGTYEAGSCVTILPETCLFHTGDYRALLQLLRSVVPKVGIGEWTAQGAADLVV